LTRQRIAHIATELGVDGRQRRRERAFRVGPHVIRQFKKYPPAIQAVIDKLRRAGFQVAPYNSSQPSTPNRVRTSLKMILVNGALCTIQVRPAFKFRPNGRDRRGFKMFPLLTATWCLCRRQHGPTIFAPRTRLKIDRLGITSICPSNQKVNQFDVQIRNPERVNILTAMAENERVVKSEKRLPCFLSAPLLVRDDC
jgi:hypothetical protein